MGLGYRPCIVSPQEQVSLAFIPRPHPRLKATIPSHLFGQWPQREDVSKTCYLTSRDVGEWIAITGASYKVRDSIAELLLKRGGRVLLTLYMILYYRDVGGWTAITWASYKGRDSIAELLLKRGAKSNVKGLYSISPLAWAAGRGHLNVVKLLLEGGAKPNTVDKYGQSRQKVQSRVQSASFFLSSYIPYFLYSYIPYFLYSLLPMFLSSYIPFFLYSFPHLFLSSFIPFFLRARMYKDVSCFHLFNLPPLFHLSLLPPFPLLVQALSRCRLQNVNKA